MDKLKIYSAYLPYKTYVKNDFSRIYELSTYSNMRSNEIERRDIQSVINVNFKPILFSLEDLTKEITIGGETFVPIVELANEFTDDSFNDYYLDKFFKTEIVLREKYSRYYFKIQFKNDKIVGFDNNDTELPQFDIFQKLLEWKFNVFNLPEIEYIKVTEENNHYK